MLQARILAPVASVNSFRYTTELRGFAGSALSVYVQLYDDSEILTTDVPKWPLNRYIPTAGAVLSVEFQSINNAVRFSRIASNPFAADDRSIFKVQTLASDPLTGTVSLKFTLTEGSTIRQFYLQAALLVTSAPGVC